MIEQVKDLVGHPGRYEGLTPFEAWLCENVDDVADETSGNTEAPTGWFARAGKHLVTTDSYGFWYVHNFKTEKEARQAFDTHEAHYADWDTDDEGDE